MSGNLLRRKFEWKRLDCHLRHLCGNSCQRKGFLSVSVSVSVSVSASGPFSFPLPLPSPFSVQLRFQSALILRQDTQFSNSAGYANYNDILAVKNLRDRSYPPEKMRMVAGKLFRQNLPLSRAKKMDISGILVQAGGRFQIVSLW